MFFLSLGGYSPSIVCLVVGLVFTGVKVYVALTRDKSARPFDSNDVVDMVWPAALTAYSTYITWGLEIDFFMNNSVIVYLVLFLLSSMAAWALAFMMHAFLWKASQALTV